jgi:hypothetical protein
MKTPKTQKFLFGFFWLNVVAAILAMTTYCAPKSDRVVP